MHVLGNQCGMTVCLLVTLRISDLSIERAVSHAWKYASSCVYVRARACSVLIPYTPYLSRKSTSSYACGNVCVCVCVYVTRVRVCMQ